MINGRSADIVACGSGTTLKDGECTPVDYVMDIRLIRGEQRELGYAMKDDLVKGFDDLEMAFGDMALREDMYNISVVLPKSRSLSVECCARHLGAGEFYENRPWMSSFNTWVPFTQDDYDKCVVQIDTRCHRDYGDRRCDSGGNTDYGCHIYGLKVRFEEGQATAFTAKCCGLHERAATYYVPSHSGRPSGVANTWQPFTQDDYDKCVTQLTGNEYFCSVDTIHFPPSDLTS